LDTLLSSLRPRARMRFLLRVCFLLLDVSFLRCRRVRILVCSWRCTTVRKYFLLCRLFEYVWTMLAKYHSTSARLMSISNRVHSPKQLVFWKWRDGGVGACPPVERSPMTQVVQQPVVQQQQPREPVQQSDVSFSRTSNKREDTCTKMGEREMMRQVGMNPFIQTDYVKGIEIRDKFLIPFHESKPSYDQDSSVSGN
jgi:hypothetical protein